MTSRGSMASACFSSDVRLQADRRVVRLKQDATRDVLAKRAFMAAVTAACALIVSGCSGRAPADAPVPVADLSTVTSIVLTADQIRHGGVRWAPATQTTIADGQELPGELQPNEDLTVRLSAPARGRIVAVHAEAGDRVRQDQILVTLQSQEGAAARAEYTKALADLQSHETSAGVAHTARERADRLLLLKAGSRQDAERARAEEGVARASQEQASADVERARAALDHLGVDPQTGEMRLRTSRAGVVLTREAVPGSVVDAGSPLLVIADLGKLWLSVNVSERLASTLRSGSRLRFAVPAYPSDTFETRVAAIAGAVDPTTRTVNVRALVSNPSWRLRPAMFATVWIEAGAPATGTRVPDTALQLLEERAVVFVARPGADGGARFERRDVQIGARANGQTRILSGLDPGALVVTDGAFVVKSEFARSKFRSES